MSLYLKYRPQNFSSLVGQKHAKQTIQNALKSHSLSHAYLFCGPRGTGKTSLARILAKGLNCESPISDTEPCNQCNICSSINAGKLVDLIEIDAASNRGIDEIRELREKIVFAPSQAKTKVYIIDEVHMLTKEAFNALLKTLEEPPSHAYFILATTEAHKIPETIVSRCQQFSFGRIEVGDISQRLKEIAITEEADFEVPALDLIARLSAGGLRDAIGLLEQMMTAGQVTVDKVSESLGLTGTEHIEKLFSLLLERKALKAIELLNQVKAKGRSTSQFLKEFIGYCREQMLINLGNSKDTQTVLRFIEIFTEASRQIDLSPIPELPIEMGIIKACEFYTEAPGDEGGRIQVSQAESRNDQRRHDAQASPSEATKTAAPTQASDLTFELIKRDWLRVMEAIETAFIRMSLKDGELVRYENNVLSMSFKSAAYMEKVNSVANQAEIQKAFEKIYGTKLTLNLELQKIELSPLVKKKESLTDKLPSTVEMAAEVFGIK